MKNVNKLTAEEVQELINNGVIREDFISLVEGFNAKFALETIEGKQMKSYRTGTEFVMPKYRLSNTDHTFTCWGSTLLSSIVIGEEAVKCVAIPAAKGLPVYFREEFNEAHPNSKKLSDLRDATGGLQLDDEYTIVGALVSRSKVDPTRWAVGFKLYEKGSSFLEYERFRLNEPNLMYVTEERIVEISKLEVTLRAYVGKTGGVTLPSFSELKIVGGAATDCRFAKATFIVAKK